MNQRIESLGRRAATALAAAGRRAFAQGDMPAAVNRLSRARLCSALHDPDRLDLLPQLAFALLETGDLAGPEAVVAEARSGDGVRRLASPGARPVLGLSMRLWSEPGGLATSAAGGDGAAGDRHFEEVGDEGGLAHAWSLLGLVHLSRAQFRPSGGGLEEGGRARPSAGDRRDELESLSWVPLMVWAGPTHVDDGLRRCREVLDGRWGSRRRRPAA